MATYRYKSFEEAERALWNFHPGNDYYQNIKNLFELATRLHKPKHPHGIFKYSTLEEANHQRFEWDLGHLEPETVHEWKGWGNIEGNIETGWNQCGWLLIITRSVAAAYGVTHHSSLVTRYSSRITALEPPAPSRSVSVDPDACISGYPEPSA